MSTPARGSAEFGALGERGSLAEIGALISASHRLVEKANTFPLSFDLDQETGWSAIGS